MIIYDYFFKGPFGLLSGVCKFEINILELESLWLEFRVVRWSFLINEQNRERGEDEVFQ